jgi:pimeloyl-ACP methyl ester carboxylesterase
VTIYWELTGSAGPALVLVHGSWGDHHGWDRIVPLLSDSFRVLTYDRRGHSQSERPASQGSVQQDVSDLEALIEHLGLAPAHVVGNSFGAAIVLRLASRRADLFRSVLLHEPPLLGLLEDSDQQLAVLDGHRAVHDLLEQGAMEEAARRFMETIAFGPGAWMQFTSELRDTFVYNAPTFLDEERDPDSRWIDLSSVNITVPILLSYGDRSPVFFPIIVEKLAKVLPQAARRTFAGSGHVPHATHPDAYVDAIRTFIASV